MRGRNLLSCVLAAALAVATAGLAGCEDEGPLEEAGKEIDKGMKKTGEEMEKAGEEIKEAFD